MTPDHIADLEDDLQLDGRAILTRVNLLSDVFKLNGDFCAPNSPWLHHLALQREDDLTDPATAGDVDPETSLRERPVDIVTHSWHDWGLGSKAAESIFRSQFKTRTYDVELNHTAQNDEHPRCAKYDTKLAGDELPVERSEVEGEYTITVPHV